MSEYRNKVPRVQVAEYDCDNVSVIFLLFYPPPLEPSLRQERERREGRGGESREGERTEHLRSTQSAGHVILYEKKRKKHGHPIPNMCARVCAYIRAFQNVKARDSLLVVK